MIKINNFPKEKVALYRYNKISDNDEFIAIIDYYQFLDVRRQIIEQKENGYFIMYKKDKINIYPNGDLAYWPNDLFKLPQKLLANIFQARKQQNNG